MRRLAAPLALLSVALALACTPGGDELSRTRVELAEARAELARTQADLLATQTQLKAAESALESIRRELTALQERLAADDARTAAADAAVAAAATAVADEGLAKAAAEAIRCDEEGRCAITRAFVDQVVADPEFLVRQARVIPSIRDGVPDGFKIYGIRTGSIPKLLGIQNGDLIDGVNEYSLRSVEDAMVAYQALRKVDVLKIRGQRKGQPFVLEVTIEGATR